MQAPNHTATRLPARPVVDSLPLLRKPRRLKRATGTFLKAGASFRARACRDWLVQSSNRTATRVPARPVVDSLCCGKATVVETAHQAVSKSHLSNPPPAFRQSEKTFLLECLFALVEGGGFEPPKS